VPTLFHLPPAQLPLKKRRNVVKQSLSRVPEVTIYFWIIKVLATTVGETAADYLAITLNLSLSLTFYIIGGLLLIALLNQFRLRRYVPLLSTGQKA
jgi:uncharacterized membrane-anchored protein